jgi:hypothetical protein
MRIHKRRTPRQYGLATGVLSFVLLAMGCSREALAGSRGEFRRSIAALDVTSLDEPCVEDMDVEEFLRMSIRHETWHAAQS